jgi:CubicO group peptidase (beta-lactamase class C family)
MTYGQALCEGKILSPDGYKTLWYDRPALKTDAPCPWAFGWAAKAHAPAYGNQYQVGMNGGVPGIASTIIIFPKSKIVVVSLSNLRKKTVPEIAKSAAKIYFGSSDSAPDEMNAGTNSGAE